MSERLERSIEELARQDRRYPPQAYMLVFEGLEVALAKLPARRHVTPHELVDGVREAALQQWGLLARTVLESWNVRSTGEIGDVPKQPVRLPFCDERLCIVLPHGGHVSQPNPHGPNEALWL